MISYLKAGALSYESNPFGRVVCSGLETERGPVIVVGRDSTGLLLTSLNNTAWDRGKEILLKKLSDSHVS